MIERGHQDREGYRNLELKLQLIQAGHTYKVYDVGEQLVKSFSAFIPVCNILTKNNPTYAFKKYNEAKDYVETMLKEELKV